MKRDIPTVACKIITLLTLVLFFVLYVVRFKMWFTHPFSNSYEEYGTVATMNSYLEGVNPFSFESFPQRTFIYGPLYAWLCSFLYSLFGFHCDHLLFCRFVSAFFLISTEVLVIITIKKRLNPSVDKLTRLLLLAIAATSLLAVSWQITPISGYSNTFGVFLTALFYVLITSKDRHKVWSLTLCSLFSLIAFFVKQYFIIVFVVAFVQLVIQRAKKQALFLLVSFIGFAVIAFVLCQAFMPTCLYVLVEAMSHQQISILHGVKQFGIIFLFYFPFFAALLYVLKTDKIAFHNVPATYKSGILVSLICLAVLSCNEGAYLWYFYHLLLLPLVICGTIALSYIKTEWQPIILLLCVIFSVFHITLTTIAPAYPKEATLALEMQLKELGKENDLSKSYNFHASLDDWAEKHKMGYVNSLYPNFLLMMKEKEEGLLFKDEHNKALVLLDNWENELRNHINDRDAELIFCNSNDKVLKRCGIDENYKLLSTFHNPDGDPKYTDIEIYIRK